MNYIKQVFPIDKDGSGEVVRNVRDPERSAPRESVQWIKHDDKSFSGSKPACACVFTDHVETETASVVCFRVCVCVYTHMLGRVCGHICM